MTADPWEGVVSIYYRPKPGYLEYDEIITQSEIWGSPIITLAAIKLKTQHGAPPLLGGYPGPINPRRGMTHMLIVTTGQSGDPVVFFIFVISNDRLLHTA